MGLSLQKCCAAGLNGYHGGYRNNKKALYTTYRALIVDRSIQLSNQFIKDFKEIVDLTYLIPVFEAEETYESIKYGA